MYSMNLEKMKIKRRYRSKLDTNGLVGEVDLFGWKSRSINDSKSNLLRALLETEDIGDRTNYKSRKFI